MGFRLADNAFAVLGVSMRATAAEIASAYQDAILDGVHTEASLATANAALSNPRERLRAEVSFLPNSNPREARAILAQVQAGNDGSVAGNGDLDNANVVADALDRGGDPSILVDLALCIADIDAAAVVADINAARQVSKVRAADLAGVREALAWLMARHAEVGAAVAARSMDGVETAESIVTSGLQSTALMPFLGAFIPEYARQTAPQLRKLESDIAELDTKLRASREQADARKLAETLMLWDRYRQPVQLWDEAQGIDEPESKALGERVRALCLYMANDHDAYDAALIVAKALRDCFGELAGLRDLFFDDVKALERLSRGAELEKFLGPLLEVVAALRADLPKTARSLAVSGIVVSVDRDLIRLRETFEQALSDAGQGEGVAVPFFMVRDLALALHNEGDFTREALSLTRWLQTLQSRAPAIVAEKLAADADILKNELAQTELKQAVQRKDLAAAHQGAMALAQSSADPETRAEWLEFAKKLAKQRESSQQDAWVKWALIVGAFILFAMFRSCSDDRPSQAYSTEATTTTEAPAADAMAAAPDWENGSMDAATATDAEVAADAAAAATQAAGEDAAAAVLDAASDWAAPEIPAVGYGQALSLAELRYCQEQNIRLSAAEGAVDNSSAPQVDGFNAAINDYNARCGSYKYRQSDMDLVSSKIAGERSSLELEGRILVGQWQ